MDKESIVPAHSEQRDPVANDLPACWDLVIAEMKDRDELGCARYGVPLQPFNGRNALRDVSEELLDAVVYHRQLRFELVHLHDDLLQLNGILEHQAGPYPKKAVDFLNSILQRYEFLKNCK